MQQSLPLPHATKIYGFFEHVHRKSFCENFNENPNKFAIDFGETIKLKVFREKTHERRKEKNQSIPIVLNEFILKY